MRSVAVLLAALLPLLPACRREGVAPDRAPAPSRSVRGPWIRLAADGRAFFQPPEASPGPALLRRGDLDPLLRWMDAQPRRGRPARPPGAGLFVLRLERRQGRLHGRLVDYGPSPDASWPWTSEPRRLAADLARACPDRRPAAVLVLGRGVRLGLLVPWLEALRGLPRSRRPEIHLDTSEPRPLPRRLTAPPTGSVFVIEEEAPPRRPARPLQVRAHPRCPAGFLVELAGLLRTGDLAGFALTVGRSPAFGLGLLLEEADLVQEDIEREIFEHERR